VLKKTGKKELNNKKIIRNTITISLKKYKEDFKKVKMKK